MHSKRALFALVALLLASACGGDDPTPPGDAGDTADAVDDAAEDVIDATDDPSADPDGTDVSEDGPTDTADADPGDIDAGDDADAGDACPTDWPEIPQSDTLVASSDGADPALEVAAGSAAGGRVRTTGSVFTGPNANCREGDYVLRNAHLRACIADTPGVLHYLFTGGHLLDLEAADRPGTDLLSLSVTSNDLLTASGDQVELVRDGSDGGPAVVRVTGVDVLPLVLAGVAGQILPARNLEFVTEYRLAPDARYLEVVSWVTPLAARTAVNPGELLIVDDAARLWYAGDGFDAEPTEGFDLVAGIAGDVSFGLYGPTAEPGGVSIPGFDLPITGVRLAAGFACALEPAAFVRYFAVGDGDTVSLRASLADVLAVPEGAATSFTYPGSAPRTFELVRDGAPVEVVRVSPDGGAIATLPPGSYVAIPAEWPSGDAPETAFEVPSDGDVVLPAPTLGTVALTVDDGSDEIPFRLAYAGPASGERFFVSGTAELALPPGDYAAEIGRGEEYTYAEVSFTVAADATVDVAATLTRWMDTTGWVSGDLHQHSAPSIDSEVAIDDRIAANLAAGLDFISPSDHDVIAPFAERIEEAGLSDRIHAMMGVEISPVYGHMNAFPATYSRDAQAGGAVLLARRLEDGRSVEMRPFPELGADALLRGYTFVQINHPRDSQGYFDYAGYDPIDGPDATDPRRWFDGFRGVEIYNSPGDFCRVARDWFGLLSRGMAVSGVGNSDTHGEGASGYPRNYIASEIDDPGDLTDDVLIAGLSGQHVTVSGGIVIDFSDGTLPGDTVAATAGEATAFPVRLRSPSWVGVDELIVYVNGVESERIALNTDPETLTDFDDTVAVTVDADAYVVFIAYSAARMTHVTPGERPFGFTNPVYLDVGGDGWTAPGVDGADSLPVVEGIPFCN